MENEDEPPTKRLKLGENMYIDVDVYVTESQEYFNKKKNPPVVPELWKNSIFFYQAVAEKDPRCYIFFPHKIKDSKNLF